MRIDGNTKSEERYQLISRFQRDGTKCQVALLSITACGTGITLTKAATIVFAELYWTPGVLIQAEDRVHDIRVLLTLVGSSYWQERRIVDTLSCSKEYY